MVGLEIKKSGFGGQTPAGLVITGGGAETVGIRDAAKRILAMPVRVGTPTQMKGIIDEVQHPAYSTVIGLTIYGSQLPTTRSGKFQMPKLGGGSGKIAKRIIEIIKSFIP
jgi:cell division protein FtsA